MCERKHVFFLCVDSGIVSDTRQDGPDYLLGARASECFLALALEPQRLLAESLTHCFTHTLTHSPTHCFTHSLTHSLTHLHTLSHTRSLTHCFTHSLCFSPYTVETTSIASSNSLSMLSIESADPDLGSVVKLLGK